MNCKYFKVRKHDNKKEKRIYYYCTLLKQEVPFSCYRECGKKEYKCSPAVKHKMEYKMEYKMEHKKKDSGFKKKNPVKTGLKQRTYKQTKKEKNRYSLFTDDLDTCIVCGKNKEHFHEIFGGRNRSNSIKYGLVLPLCSACHRRIHDNHFLIEEWHKKGQVIFNTTYSGLNFIDIFKQDYIYLYEKETKNRF